MTDPARSHNDLSEEIERLKLQLRLAKGFCEVCWTTSWCPIPDEEEADCRLVHPHEGPHARCDHCWLAAVTQERDRLWASGICSRHKHPTPRCDICNSKMWSQWVVEYDENSVAWVQSVSHPDVRAPLEHGKSISDAIGEIRHV